MLGLAEELCKPVDLLLGDPQVVDQRPQPLQIQLVPFLGLDFICAVYTRLTEGDEVGPHLANRLSETSIPLLAAL